MNGVPVVRHPLGPPPTLARLAGRHESAHVANKPTAVRRRAVSLELAPPIWLGRVAGKGHQLQISCSLSSFPADRASLPSFGAVVRGRFLISHSAAYGSVDILRLQVAVCHVFRPPTVQSGRDNSLGGWDGIRGWELSLLLDIERKPWNVRSNTGRMMGLLDIVMTKSTTARQKISRNIM
jgi:hypothetical protein